MTIQATPRIQEGTAMVAADILRHLNSDEGYGVALGMLRALDPQELLQTFQAFHAAQMAARGEIIRRRHAERSHRRATA